jgi:hypothetical protein
MIRPIVSPTVPRGSERVRICLHAGNGKDEAEGLCRAVETWVANQMCQRRGAGNFPVGDEVEIDKKGAPPKPRL